ncbi:hypothetical protein AAES_04296 [Amazona aestiva]|uniref:Uncharacterized protein n=1 Tax=Amazona aestiva TaxID=12930 RepID=A0A0Q3XB02_AMAAE|nr:hypothetical protein AAES_04296 [Amazona aestiva]
MSLSWSTRGLSFTKQIVFLLDSKLERFSILSSIYEYLLLYESHVAQAGFAAEAEKKSLMLNKNVLKVINPIRLSSGL